MIISITFFLLLVLVWIVGILTGISIGKSKKDGLFIIDDVDENTTTWRLDVNFDPEEISKKKYLRFKVCKMDNDGKS